MSDLELRELERRWQETGSSEEGAQFLRALARAGRVSDEQLSALAFLGYEPARRATGAAPPDAWDADDPGVWAVRIRVLGAPGLVRACLALARGGIGPWAAANPGREGVLLQVLQAVVAWLRIPGAEEREAASRASKVRYQESIEVEEDEEGHEVEVDRAAWALNVACEAASAVARGTVAAATQALCSCARDAGKDRAAQRRVILEALAPWVLGQGDPVLELRGTPDMGGGPRRLRVQLAGAPVTPAFEALHLLVRAAAELAHPGAVLREVRRVRLLAPLSPSDELELVLEPVVDGTLRGEVRLARGPVITCELRFEAGWGD